MPKPHGFIDRLTPERGAPPKLRMLQGYIGRSPEKGSIRMYLDIELRRYVDIPESGIEHFEDFRTKENPLASVLVWVNQDVAIRHYGNWASSEDPTTMATGEEGGEDPTTMATGEESGDFINPGELVSNPFGAFFKSK